MNLHSTDGAPVATLGNKGDFAFDPKTRTIYGPKDTATWPTGNAFDPAGSAADAETAAKRDVWEVAISDETSDITTGTAKVTFRAPRACTVTAVRASVNTVSSSGAPTFDINEGGVSILSTKLSIDASEKTSVTAAVPAVISDPALADDAEITIDIDTAGTGAKGAKIQIYVTYP